MRLWSLSHGECDLLIQTHADDEDSESVDVVVLLDLVKVVFVLLILGGRPRARPDPPIYVGGVGAARVRPPARIILICLFGIKSDR